MKQFRLLSYLFVAVLCLGFVSCSDDDDDEDSQIVGSWTVTKDEGSEYYNGEPDTWNESYESGEWVYTFNGDGTGEEYDEDGTYDFTWVLKGNKLTMDYGNNEIITITIAKLNSTDLIFEQKGKDKEGDYYYKLTMKKYSMPK